MDLRKPEANGYWPDCPACKGTGMRDSGGVMPWGDAILLPCDCDEPEPAPTADHGCAELDAIATAVSRGRSGEYRGFRIEYDPMVQPGADWLWIDDDRNEDPARQGRAASDHEARAMVDEILAEDL